LSSQKLYNRYAPGPTKAPFLGEKTDTTLNERWVVLTATLTIQHEYPPNGIINVIKKTDGFDRYIIYSDRARVAFKINKKDYQSAIRTIMPLGRVVGRQVTGEDVTGQFYHLDNQLKSARHSKQRYMALIRHTQSINESILLEKELERIDSTIDLHKKELKKTRHQNAYFTIEVGMIQPPLLCRA